MTRMFDRLRAGAWLMLLLAGSAHAQEILPIDYFTRSDDVGTMKLSPEGDYLAITTGQHGAEFLTFVNIDDPKIGASLRAPDGLIVLDFHWASNTRVIFTVAERYGREQPSWFGEIYGVDRDGGRQVRIYGFRSGERSTGTILKTREASFAHADVVSLLDDDDRSILIREMPWVLSGNRYRYDEDVKPQLVRLDTYNGKKNTVGGAPLPSAEVIVDRDDVPRFAIGVTKGFQHTVAWRRTKDADWETFELPGFRSNTIEPLRFNTNNTGVLITAVREGQRHAALFELTLADHSIKQLIDIPDTDVAGIVTDFQDNEVIGVVGYTDKLVHRWLLPDHPAARLYQALQRAFDGNEVQFISQSQDGKRAIVFVRSDVAPGEYFLLDTETKKADMIRAARAWVDIKKMRPKESIRLEARDGLALHGYLTRPSSAGPHPLVVLPHGGPHGVRDWWTFDWEAQLLANRGYAVLQVNFRGSGGYGVDFEMAGHRQWGAKMQDDVTDATRWAIAQNITTADRICIYGGSFGAYAALMGAAREPSLYRCAIGDAGVYDLPLMFETGDIPESDQGKDYLGMALGTDATDLRNRSPTTHAKSITAPVLLIHGTQDHRADYKQGKLMKEALEKSGKNVEWVPLRLEGHGVYNDTTRAGVYQKIVEFLDKHLKGPATE